MTVIREFVTVDCERNQSCLKLMQWATFDYCHIHDIHVNESGPQPSLNVTLILVCLTSTVTVNPLVIIMLILNVTANWSCLTVDRDSKQGVFKLRF